MSFYLKTETAGPETHAPRFSCRVKNAYRGPQVENPGHRFYSSSMGRWVNRDPIEEKGGFAIYCFAVNSPLNRADSLGMDDRVNVRIVPRIVKDITPLNGMRWRAGGGFGLLPSTCNCRAATKREEVWEILDRTCGLTLKFVEAPTAREYNFGTALWDPRASSRRVVLSSESDVVDFAAVVAAIYGQTYIGWSPGVLVTQRRALPDGPFVWRFTGADGVTRLDKQDVNEADCAAICASWNP